ERRRAGSAQYETEQEPDMHNANEVARQLISRFAPEYRMQIRLDDQTIAIACNRADIREQLSRYFRHIVEPHDGQEPQVFVLHADTKEPSLASPLTAWAREPGKTRQKEAFAELAGGRLIAKVRTGMQFLVSPERILALGDCRSNLNQVINVINARYITHLLQAGGVLCHAAAAAGAGTGVAFAGVSGAGKSTLMLHCVGRGASFTSNDRLILEDSHPVRMRGVPKLPRINPGTALSIKELQSILDAERRRELEGWDADALWNLEEKYDVDVETIYGSNRIVHAAPLDGFIVLTWSRTNGTQCRIERLDIDDDPRLLEAICKSPGPFHFDESGQFLSGYQPPSPDAYREILSRVPIYRIDGGIDFDAAANHALEILQIKT
ncbi:MAG: HprK-related kinase B, partial [Myxococcales bacterium]|nr:HprK-related kinase B [Myxococcales bacterium]